MEELKPYVPMHAESVYSFADEHCGECVKDTNEDCPHLAAAFRGEVSTWVMNGAGRVCCTAKRLPGEPERCQVTMELPLPPPPKEQK
jgi:hypothetical protein